MLYLHIIHGVITCECFQELFPGLSIVQWNIWELLREGLYELSQECGEVTIHLGSLCPIYWCGVPLLQKTSNQTPKGIKTHIHHKCYTGHLGTVLIGQYLHENIVTKERLVE